MFCSRCGKQISDGAVFCPLCGARQTRQTQAAPTLSPEQNGASKERNDAPKAAAATWSTTPHSKKDVIVPVAAAAIVMAVVLVIGLCTSWFGIGGASAVRGDIKASVNDYTWSELSSIAQEISESGSEKAALQIAEAYNLCSSDGKLDGTQTKSVTLNDGTKVQVRIAGFYHDDKSNGSGKAGITFIFKDSIASYSFNSGDSNSGGWRSSGIRSWMSSYLITRLPQDLQNHIVAVDKLTNNVGQTQSVSSVTVTSDKLWLFSVAELCGNVKQWNEYSQYSYCNDILAAEGTEYQLFADCNVLHGKNNSILTGGGWTRSSDPRDSYDALNISGTDPGYGTGPSWSCAIAPGFCL